AADPGARRLVDDSQPALPGRGPGRLALILGRGILWRRRLGPVVDGPGARARRTGAGHRRHRDALVGDRRAPAFRRTAEPETIGPWPGCHRRRGPDRARLKARD